MEGNVKAEVILLINWNIYPEKSEKFLISLIILECLIECVTHIVCHWVNIKWWPAYYEIIQMMEIASRKSHY